MKQSGVFYLLAGDPRSYSFFFRFAFDFGLENWRNGPLAQKANIQSKSKKIHIWYMVVVPACKPISGPA